MQLFSKYKLSKSQFLSLLLALMPISFIAGNMIINLNVILLILLTIIFFGKETFKIKYFFLDKVIFGYFCFVLLTGVINDYHFYNIKLSFKYFDTILNSVLYIKFLLLYLIIRFLIEKQIVKLKLFFYSAGFFSVFVCLDIFYQFFNGEDIFGYKIIHTGRKLSGPFGDELIAGGYIQRFSLFAFFILPLFFQNKSRKINLIIIPLLFSIFLIGIILSGNRMPFVLYILMISLICIFQKDLRKYFFPGITLIALVFFVIFNLNIEVKRNFLNFYNQIDNIKNFVFKLEKNTDFNSQYLKEFSTFYDTWLLNKYIGGGIKNFRVYCHHRQNIDKNAKFICNMHPHNYYLEILSDLGIFGSFILIIIFFNIIYISFLKNYFSKNNYQTKIMLVPFIFLFLIEIFPLKSTGSFFTTGNATYLFLIMSILVALARADNSIENE